MSNQADDNITLVTEHIARNLKEPQTNSTAKPQMPPCTPCMLRAAQANASRGPSLTVQAALDDYTRYRLKYSLLPADETELTDFITGKFAHIKAINKVPPMPGENTYPARPFWFKDSQAQKSYQVFTSLFAGLGIAEKYMPGAETPVCDGTDFVSLLNTGTLTGLKTAGVDVIVIVLPDSIDVARAWGEKHLAAVGLAHLMPSSLNELDLQQRLEPHPTLPRIIMWGEKDLARTNEMGLVKTDGKRLMLTNERAFTLYDRYGVLRHLEKAPDTGLEMCKLHVTGDKMLAKARQLNLKAEAYSTLKSTA